MTARRLALAVLLPALAGCVLSDSGELTLLPEGELSGGAWVALEVRGPVRRIALEVDGERIPGAFPANVPLGVALDPGLREGTHVLVARALDGSSARSVKRTLRVRRGRELVTSVEPPDGAYPAADPMTDTPLVVEIRFTRPLVPELAAHDAVFAGRPSIASVLPDGHTLRVALGQSLDRVGEATLEVAPTIVDPPAPGGWSFTWTRLAGKASTFAWRTASQATPGTVALRLEPVSGDPPSYIELTAGSLRIGRIDAAGGWTLAWDTTQVPEGLYKVEATPQGDSDLTLQGDAPWIRVDRSPPALVRCIDTAPGCFVVSLDEPARVVEAAVRFGADTATVTYGSTSSTAQQICPTWATDLGPLWRSQHLVATVEDEVGLRSTVSCDRGQTTWLEPFPPMEGAYTELSVALPNACYPPLPNFYDADTVLAVAAPGTADAGRLVSQYLARLNTYPPTVEWHRYMPGAVGAVAREPSDRAWIESAGGGPGQVIVNGASHNIDPAQDARHPFTLLGKGLVAWSESVDGGGRVIRMYQFPFDPPPPAAPRSADEPALASWTVRVQTGPDTFDTLDWIYAVWTEAAPGENGRLAGARVRYRAPPLWEPIPSIAALAQDAVAPSLWGRDGWQAVAWTEGGRPVVSVSHDGLVFEAPSELAVDPSRAARGAVLDPWAPVPTVYWIERDTSGNDLLLSRRWNGGWELQPVPVNAGVPGEVRDFSVNLGVIGWLDADGHVHVRRAGC
ncbi:MAG: hypothetical protein QM704_05540 [Anaeromyxobacteraceae bacterium]